MLVIATPLCLLTALYLLGGLSTPALAYNHPDESFVTGHFLAGDAADNARWGTTTPLAFLELIGGLCRFSAQEGVFNGASRGIERLVERILQVCADRHSETETHDPRRLCLP